MRLSKRLIDIIKKSIYSSFGDVDIYLFGSRVDDSLSGGDIDLAIKSNLNLDKFKKRKALFVTNMIRKGYDLKIDLVEYNNKDILLKKELSNSAIKL
jgi:uncharacterized protein